jgi:competence protein ComEC
MTLVWISISFIAGIILASLPFFSATFWFGFALAFLFINLLFLLLARLSELPRFESKWVLKVFPVLPRFYFAIFIFFFAGMARYHFAQPDFDDPFFIGFYNDRQYEVLVTGTLAEPPDIRDAYINLKIKVEAVDSGSGTLPAEGMILTRILPNRVYEYGQRVRVRGSLKSPPENEEFSYRNYLARNGVHAIMSNAEVTTLPGNGGNFFFHGVYQLKNKLLQNIYRIYHDPEASLLAGILLGVDTGLTRELQDAFKNTGTAHIIAISGFNIAIIASLFFNFFKSFAGERLGAFLAAAGITLYALLVGANAAVLRAAVMGIMSLLARQTGRRNSGLNGLAFAALFLLFINPLSISDVGFQLSFLATLGLILYAEPFSVFTANLLSKIFKNDISAFSRFINDNVVLTFAAQLTTIPIMAYHFKRISLISFIANPFILPAQPAVMIASGAAAFASLLLLPIGQLFAWFAAPFAIYTIRIVEFFGNIPGGVYVLKDSSIWAVIVTYAALFSVTFFWSSITEWGQSQKDSVRSVAVTTLFGALFVCTIMLWRATATTGDGQLHITFLEVGSANAVLIQTPEGRNVLINGGEKTAQLSDELGRRLPYFNKELDWLVIASTYEDELAALPRIVERYPPKQILWSGNAQASYSAQTLDKYFAAHEIPITRAEVGQRLALGDGAFIEVKSAGGKGSALLIQYKNFRALLPIGLNVDTYQFLAEKDALKKVDVFLLADSGYAPSNPPDVIKRLNPQLVVLSVEAGDPDGLPHEEVLDALEGYSLLRTDRSGWISVITNGDEMRVEVERGNIAPTPTP